MTQKSEEKWKEVFIFREIENIQAYSFEAFLQKLSEAYRAGLASKSAITSRPEFKVTRIELNAQSSDFCRSYLELSILGRYNVTAENIMNETEREARFLFEAEIVIKKIFEEHPSLASKYKPIETT